MAIDLITGHQGVSHISADQIATINNAMMDNFGANKVMRLVGGELTADGLTITISEGYWRVNGFDMEIQEGETLYIDPTATGLSRIDNIYVEILQDIPTGAQRSEIVTVNGEPSATPTAPEAPTAPELNTDILLQVVPLASVTVTEGAMVMTDLTIAYEMVTPSELEAVETAVTDIVNVYGAVETAVTDIVNVYGAKNLCPTMNPSDPSTTSVWSSYLKINTDGSITANGTPSSRASIASRVVLPAGQYIMNGCPRGGDWNTYRLQFLKYTPSEVVVYSDRGSTPTTVTLDEETEIVIRLDLYPRYTASNLVFKPMIRLASITDDTYEPYAKTNQQLTKDSVTWDDLSEVGAVNACILETWNSNSSNVRSQNGVTGTIANGTVVFNSAGSASTGTIYWQTTQFTLKKGTYKFRVKGATNSGFTIIRLIKYSDSSGIIALTSTDEGIFTLSADTEVALMFTDNVGNKTFNNVALTPMICSVEYNGSDVPYAKSNKELTDAFTNQVADSDDAYSPSKAYKVGEHCIYNNVLYKCITACSAAAWSVNQNCFSATTLTSAVTDFNNDLSSYAKLSGATFTGQLNLTNVTGSSKGIALKDTSNNTRAIRLESNGGGAVAFKMGAPLKSSYGVMEIGALNDSNGVHTYGSYLSVYNYAGSALVGVNASAFNVGSSRRYKENIQNMTEKEAKKLLDVDVVTFDYKADSGIAIGDDRFNRQGVIAEDVNNICPDVVTNRIIDGKDMIDSVDYSKFVPRLIKMVQIQEMRIKELEAKSL